MVLASTSDTGREGNSYSSRPSLSADGAAVGFHSSATNFDPADIDDSYDIHVKNLTSGDIALASISDTGVKGNGSSYAPSVSADGTMVAFESTAANLHPADTDTFSDVYVQSLASEVAVSVGDQSTTEGRQRNPTSGLRRDPFSCQSVHGDRRVRHGERHRYGRKRLRGRVSTGRGRRWPPRRRTPSPPARRTPRA